MLAIWKKREGNKIALIAEDREGDKRIHKTKIVSAESSGPSELRKLALDWEAECFSEKAERLKHRFDDGAIDRTHAGREKF
ncbi:MAG: hypothetical protein K6T85_12780 [Gorillibacterium sp.]|nr:hypothetical protein [Gorillibacterium sp.]